MDNELVDTYKRYTAYLETFQRQTSWYMTGKWCYHFRGVYSWPLSARKYIRLLDGGTMWVGSLCIVSCQNPNFFLLRGLDFAPFDSSRLNDDTPIIVVMHGLTGGMTRISVEKKSYSYVRIGSYESYVRAILVPACTPVAQGGLGFRAVVVNFRGCRRISLWPRNIN